jgi:hypothetical protein
LPSPTPAPDQDLRGTEAPFRRIRSGGIVPADTKRMLDDLHLAKIRAADEVLVIAPTGYMGSSTRRELACSLAFGKPASTSARSQRSTGMRVEFSQNSARCELF